jgi:integrase
MRFAHEEIYIAEMPTFRMPKLRRVQLNVLEEADIQKIFGACEKLRDSMIVAFFISSGLRLSELCSLDWKDINLKTGQVQVIHGKGKKFRIVMVEKQTLRLIIQYHHSLKNKSEKFVEPFIPLVQTDEHKRFSSSGLRMVINRISEKSGIKITPHGLRRTFAKMAIKNGLDIVWLSELMGHSEISTTRKYIQNLDVEDVQKNYHQFSPLRDIKIGKPK